MAALYVLCFFFLSIFFTYSAAIPSPRRNPRITRIFRKSMASFILDSHNEMLKKNMSL